MPKLIFLIFLMSCATVTDQEVSYQSSTGKDFAFKNKDISFEYTPTILNDSIEIKVQNLTEESLKIDWDKSAFIDVEGNSLRIIHNGVKYNERNNSQVPTSLPPKGRISDSLTPADHIDWYKEDWWIEPICGIKNYPMRNWEDHKKSCFGSDLSLFIAYELNGKAKNFTVTFKAKRLPKAAK